MRCVRSRLFQGAETVERILAEKPETGADGGSASGFESGETSAVEDCRGRGGVHRQRLKWILRRRFAVFMFSVAFYEIYRCEVRSGFIKLGPRTIHGKIC